MADPLDPTRFRSLMGRWATGVSIVTARGPAGDAGMTVNALLSVALRPPSLLVSIAQDADTLPAIESSHHFGVSLLAADQRPLSERFARPVPGTQKFEGVALHRGPAGSPLLDGTLAVAECRLARTVPAFDHLLLVGEVVHAETGPDGPPLLFFRSGYAEADGASTLRLPPPRA